jgi:hypothetical protein
MRSKKETRSLLPGVRRLLWLLANIHPMVVAVSLTREANYERGVQPKRD